GAGLTGYKHGLSMSGHAVHHAHELVHHRAGNQKLCAVDVTPRHWHRRRSDWGLLFFDFTGPLACPLNGESQNACGRCIRIAQQRQTQMNIDVLAGLSAATEFALESSFLKNRRNRPAGEKCLLFDPVKGGDILADQFLRLKAVSIYTPITTGDDSIKVSGEDCVLQLVQNAGLNTELNIGMTYGLTRRGNCLARSAPSCGFRRSLRWRSLR